MGQTQILMIVLAIIIIAAAVAVGLRQFGKAGEQADLDAARQDCQRVAAAALAWYQKPAELGGGGRSWTGVTFDKIGDDGKTTGGVAMTIADSSGWLKITAPTAKKNIFGIIHPDSSRGLITRAENK
jgi:type II secretory pathway pseudopilin PulG